MNIDYSTKPQIQISLNPVLESYVRYEFKIPTNQREIIVRRNTDIGKLIHSNIITNDLPVKRPFDLNPVVFILPINKVNHHYIRFHFLSVSTWGEQKIQDGIEYEFRKWVDRKFEKGYKKKYTQKQIVEAILRGLNIRNNSANFDAIKKIDYRNGRKEEEKRFEELLLADI
ncbi:hypothetical protein [Mangrovibacterium sp.]|uniref:hypothetical protein n=1 Tax=Mangrovibacterium sp. TaxID=1961364 RepID=UPI00356A31C2